MTTIGILKNDDVVKSYSNPSDANLNKEEKKSEFGTAFCTLEPQGKKNAQPKSVHVWLLDPSFVRSLKHKIFNGDISTFDGKKEVMAFQPVVSLGRRDLAVEKTKLCEQLDRLTRPVLNGGQEAPAQAQGNVQQKIEHHHHHGEMNPTQKANKLKLTTPLNDPMQEHLRNIINAGFMTVNPQDEDFEESSDLVHIIELVSQNVDDRLKPSLQYYIKKILCRKHFGNKSLRGMKTPLLRDPGDANEVRTKDEWNEIHPSIAAEVLLNLLRYNADCYNKQNKTKNGARVVDEADEDRGSKRNRVDLTPEKQVYEISSDDEVDSDAKELLAMQ